MPLSWIFDPALPSGSRKGGLASAQLFDPSVDAFVREVLQNSRDQRLEDDARVDVRFTLAEISGAPLAAFLEAIGWPELREHVEATAKPEFVTIGPRLQEGLAEVAGGTLRVLGIQDSGTRGLTGGEEDESNFAALVRHDLITSDQRRESGGSFGVGKSVLWRFSNLSTVFFHSLLSDLQRSRFIGRTMLAGHAAAGERWEGSGWFGAPDPAEPKRAISLWDDEARRVAELMNLTRPAGLSGTSILVVGFDDPGREAEGSVEEICREMVDSATRWFWPALCKDDMSVLVDGYEGDERVFSAHAQSSNAEIAPFVHAEYDTPSPSDVLEDAGDVIEREIKITVPRQRPELFEDPHPSNEASVTLRFRLAETGETELLNTIALQRGTGMVVDYRKLRTPSGIELGLHGVLLAGRAHGDADSDRALEAFLRAAEPPAHEEWTYTTGRIKSEYGYGFKKALDELYAAIDGALRELAREEEIETDEGPDALRKLFPLPGIGPVVRTETYRLTEAHAELEDHRWSFEGRYRRTPVDEQESGRDWEFRLALAVDQEGTGKPTGIPIEEFFAEAPATAGDSGSDGAVVVTVPAGVEEVGFNGTAEPLDQLPPGGDRRVRLRMDIKAATRKEQRDDQD